ncbi:MAG: nonstructural protein [Arizlama microvirus]|nr:MAG: nonstructural protein [Arizlama microvirus]
MVTKIFAVRDIKAAIYHQPFYMQNEVLATRSLQQAVNNKDTQLFQYAEDFSLHELGTWDDNSGTFSIYPQHKHIINCIQLKPTQAPTAPEVAAIGTR